MKERLDVLLVQKGLAPSREKAKTMIMEGNVFVDNQREDKAGTFFDPSVNIEIHGNTLRYVSRGGLKLEKAMAQFGITLDDKVCMDIGASTGGFTDCMLQNGAKKVYAVDVGYGQFAWKLRQDPRVVCMEKTNIRYVTPEDIGDALNFASVDVSFISLTKVLGPAKELLKDGGQMVCLIKPQFEAGKDKVGKKGVVRDPAVHKEVIERVILFAKSIGFGILHLDYSPCHTRIRYESIATTFLQIPVLTTYRANTLAVFLTQDLCRPIHQNFIVHKSLYIQLPSIHKALLGIFFLTYFRFRRINDSVKLKLHCCRYFSKAPVTFRVKGKLCSAGYFCLVHTDVGKSKMNGCLLHNREISLAALKACHLKRNGNSLYLAFGC